MAARTNRVEVEITATDEATPKIERLEKKIDGLEADEARITITAQTDRLEQQLATAKQKLEGLDGDEATVQLRAVGTLEQELEQARTLLSQLDGKTGTVKISARDTATADIKDVGDELRRLDGKSADVRVGVSDGLGAGLGAAGGVAGLAAGLGLAGSNAATLAIQVQAIANRTGASLEDASRLVAVFQDSGIEASDLSDILLQVNGALRDNPELADQLGVKIGENTDLIDVFLQAVKGLESGFDDVGEAGVIASQLLGEEGVKQVDIVIASVGDLQKAVEDVPQARIYNKQDVDNAKELNTQLAETKANITEIGIVIIPILNKLLEAAAHPRESGLLGALIVPGRAVTGAIFGEGNNVTTGPFPPAQRGQGVFPTVTVINPPHVQTTVDSLSTWTARNGPR